MLSVMRSVSVPLGITTTNRPNISSTLWRTVADQKNKIYYFDSATSPNVFWIALSELNFSKNNPIKKLDLSNNKFYAGNAIDSFIISKPFSFLSAQ